MACQPGAGSHGPARRPGRGAARCPHGPGDGQARGRRGRAGARGRGWRGGGDHHLLGSHPVAPPLAGARQQGTRRQSARRQSARWWSARWWRARRQGTPAGQAEPGQVVTRMTVSRLTAQVDSESVTRNRVSVRESYLLIYGALADQASWLRVIRYARCADASLDADQWFPISAEAGKARQEAAAAIV